MASAFKNKRSEDEIGEKYDQCISDTIIKTASGVGVGVVLSFVAFQRKAWPIAFSTGMGLGMAISNCQNEFKGIYPVKTVKVTSMNSSELSSESSELSVKEEHSVKEEQSVKEDHSVNEEAS